MNQQHIDAAQQKRVVNLLRAALPIGQLLWTEEDTKPYECDGLSAFRQLPMIVALPATLEQVQAILKICYALRVPVIARGAGTGLSGGAMPRADGVVWSLAKFNQS